MQQQLSRTIMICGADHRSFGWELTDHFSPYNNLVQALPTKDKCDMPKKKTNTFLEQALNRLDKHFHRWAVEVLFLALWGEGHLAGVVARFIMKLCYATH
jgi:hypothetical protein